MSTPLLRRIAGPLGRLIGPHRAFYALSLYPPFLGAGVRVVSVDPALRTFEVQMRLTTWNQNYVGTQFGGSLYAMCDPFFMLILMENLGPGYVIWDKAASIRFVKPGRGTMRARFHIPGERIEELRRQVDAAGTLEAQFEAEVRSEEGETVARVEKVVHLRRKAGR